MRAPPACLLVAVCLSFASFAVAAEPLDLAPIKHWIAKQDELHTVQADFTQTRALRALRSPIATPGHIWFGGSDTLRWELGEPAKTIVIRKGETYFLIQPAKKKVERYKADSIAKHGGAMGF